MADLNFSQGADPVAIFNDQSGNELSINLDGSLDARTKDGAGSSITGSGLGPKYALDVAQPGMYSSGSISAYGQYVVIPTLALSTAVLAFTGTWSGTLVIQGSSDNGVSYITMNCNFASSGITPYIFSNGVATASCAGFTHIRIAVNSWTSGTVTINWSTGAGSQLQQVYNVGTPTALLATVYQPTGTFLHTVVDSIAALPLPTGAATEATLLAAKVNLDKFTFGSTRLLVDGSGVTQPVSIATMPTTPVTGTFWQATQPISAISLPLPTGAATEATLSALATKINSQGQKVMAASTPVVLASDQTTIPVQRPDATLAITATGATGVAVTLTLPAVAAQFHHINTIEIMAYSTAARTGSATPITVTSTDLPGSPAWTFATAAAIGTVDTKSFSYNSPLRSSVINTATTIVCPATTGIIWRVNVTYYTGV